MNYVKAKGLVPGDLLARDDSGGVWVVTSVRRSKPSVQQVRILGNGHPLQGCYDITLLSPDKSFLHFNATKFLTSWRLLSKDPINLLNVDEYVRTK